MAQLTFGRHVDISLLPHSNDPNLILREIKRFADGSGFCCQLQVHSNGFTGQQLFCFEVEPLRQFVAALDEMNCRLTGSARLQPMYEEPYVELEAHSRTGRVTVRGELVVYSAETQRLVFGFDTDQTCLAPLLRALRSCLTLPVS